MPVDQQRGADAHVEKLWTILDARKEGAVDLNGLKRGLKKMDHRKI
jgi:solute carrier family 25 phosphate transporter 23/24/25/41